MGKKARHSSHRSSSTGDKQYQTATSRNFVRAKKKIIIIIIQKKEERCRQSSPKIYEGASLPQLNPFSSLALSNPSSADSRDDRVRQQVACHAEPHEQRKSSVLEASYYVTPRCETKLSKHACLRCFDIVRTRDKTSSRRMCCLSRHVCMQLGADNVYQWKIARPRAQY